MVLIYPYCYFYFLPYISSAAIFSFNRQFHPDNHSCAEQVIPTNHQVAFHLPIYLPTLTQRVTMLISGVYAAHHIVPVRAERTAYAQVAMVVASSCHARLVGYAQAPRVVVAPKRLRAYVTARSAFVPFQIHVPEILPSVMKFAFRLVLWSAPCHWGKSFSVSPRCYGSRAGTTYLVPTSFLAVTQSPAHW